MEKRQIPTIDEMKAMKTREFIEKYCAIPGRENPIVLRDYEIYLLEMIEKAIKENKSLIVKPRIKCH